MSNPDTSIDLEDTEKVYDKADRRKAMSTMSIEIAESSVNVILDPLYIPKQIREQLVAALASWIETAAMNQSDTYYYMGLLDQCAEHLGEDVYICDDGSRSESPLRAKIPELVKALVCG